MSVPACRPPTISYEHCTFILYFVGQPYRWLNIHPSEQGARICFDYDCSDNYVKLKGYRNKLEAVQVPNIHSAGCSLYSQVAILQHFRWRSQPESCNLTTLRSVTFYIIKVEQLIYGTKYFLVQLIIVNWFISSQYALTRP